MAKNDNKTHDPTPRKLSDARRDGSVARSPFVPVAASLVAIALCGPFIAAALVHWLTSMTRALTFSSDVASLTRGSMVDLALDMTVRWLPVMIIVPLAGVLGVVAQGGVVTAGKQQGPGFKNLSPMKGLRQLSPKQAAAELARSTIKVVVVIGVLWGPARELIDQLAMPRETSTTALFVAEAVSDVIWRVAFVAAILAVGDYMLARRKFRKDMMMSRQELMDESKRSEGDPQLRSARRRRAMEVSRRRQLADVVTADVVITNPTRFAVALTYAAGDPSPKVVASGTNRNAAKIRKKATESGVPIIEAPPLARALFRSCRVGSFVPTQLFDEVIEVLVQAYLRRGRFPDHVLTANTGDA